MTFLENLQTGKYNCILFTIIFIILFHSYWTKPECMTDTPAVSTTAINDAIKAVYVADVAAIRNLSNIATQLTSVNGLTIPGPVSMNGGVNTGKITNNSTESFCIYSSNWIDLRTKSGIHIRNDDGSGNLSADGNINSDTLDVRTAGTIKNLTLSGTLNSGGGVGTADQYLVSTGPNTPPKWQTPPPPPPSGIMVIKKSDGNGWGVNTDANTVSTRLYPTNNCNTIIMTPGGTFFYEIGDGGGTDYVKMYFVISQWDDSNASINYKELFNGNTAKKYYYGTRGKVTVNVKDYIYDSVGVEQNKFIKVDMKVDKRTDDRCTITWSDIIFLLV